MWKALPSCLGWGRFVELWRLGDLILTSLHKVRDKAQQLLLQRYKEHFPDMLVPLLYHPKDSRMPNILLTIPGTRQQAGQQVLNDIVDVSIEATEQVIKTDAWRLGYALTVHSNQGLTSPTKGLDH